MIKYILKNPLVKNILSALAVAGVGFVLLNLTFLFDYIFQSAVIWFIKLFTSDNPPMAWYWFPPVMHIVFVVLIGLISWAVFRTKFRVLFKAIYMIVPTAVVLVTLGMFFYQWPVVPYLLGALLIAGVLCYFHRTKQPWLYYYSVILISLVLAIFTFLGGEI